MTAALSAPARTASGSLRRWCGLLLCLAAALLAACANPLQIPPGTPATEVLSTLGQPTARYPLAGGGERLQYSSQPSGRTVYNVDFDPAGRLVRAEQALDEGLFPQRIKPNLWTREDVLREYGRPARIEGVHNFVGQIWVWRFLEGPVWRLLFIDVDPGGVVRNWSAGDENMPDPPDRL